MEDRAISRAETWELLRRPMHLLVIGGGVTGAGIAREAALRGLSVAVVERSDIGYGTSSRSSKLIHGGFRYLQQAEFGLVSESVSERHVLMRTLAPHLVVPMPFMFPVYRGARIGLKTLNIGMWIYDALAFFRAPAIHRPIGAARAMELEPTLKRDRLRGAPVYYDCATDDARLTVETAIDAAEHGAAVCTWTDAVALLHSRAGRVVGALVRDLLTGQERELLADVVVQATGPWTDRLPGVGGQGDCERLLRPTKGVHITVPRERLPIHHAIVCFHPRDGRVLFAVPWDDRTYVGTTDTDYEGDPADVAATAEDVGYLLEVCTTYFPSVALAPTDIVSTWAGLRPLLRPESEGGTLRESEVSREHEILVRDDGLVTIAGGKLTTYRRMAHEVLEAAVASTPGFARLHGALVAGDTRRALPGAVGFLAAGGREGVARRVLETAPALGPEIAAHLARTYGIRAIDIASCCAQTPSLGTSLAHGRPEILAQVDWAVDRELATRAVDVLVRRTQIFFKDADQGLGTAATVVARMGDKLGWSPARRAEELALYRTEVARSRAWKMEEKG